MKEIFEELMNRSRSHFFGSIMISFLIFNWQPLYFVIYADVDILEKFDYFDCYVKVWQPIIIGFGLALLSPALMWGGTWWAEKFTTKVKKIQAGAASSVAIEEMGLENDRAKAKAKIAVTVDDALRKIGDETVRDKFREDVFSDKGYSHQLSEKELKEIVVNLSQTARLILILLVGSAEGDLAMHGYGEGGTIYIDGELLELTDIAIGMRAISALKKDGLIEHLDIPQDLGIRYRLTTHGRIVAKILTDNWEES